MRQIPYTFFTFLSFLKLLSLFISISPYISYIYQIFLFFSISQLSDFAKKSANIAGIIVKSSVNSIERIISIPSNFNVSKKYDYIYSYIFSYGYTLSWCSGNSILLKTQMSPNFSTDIRECISIIELINKKR